MRDCPGPPETNNDMAAEKPEAATAKTNQTLGAVSGLGQLLGSFPDKESRAMPGNGNNGNGNGKLPLNGDQSPCFHGLVTL